MYNVVGYKNKPAVVISKNDSVASVMYFIEEDNMIKAAIDTVYDKALIADYKCPYADETDPARIYCSEGRCKYQIKSPAQLSFICSGCLAESYIFEDNNIDR
jgi:hypothetical protein